MKSVGNFDSGWTCLEILILGGSDWASVDVERNWLEIIRRWLELVGNSNCWCNVCKYLIVG